MTDPGTIGARLKAERERRGLSPQKAADELHLDGWVIDALEADDYGRIGPSVYAKGHLKRYAALLGLPSAGNHGRLRIPAPSARAGGVAAGQCETAHLPSLRERFALAADCGFGCRGIAGCRCALVETVAAARGGPGG